VYGDAPPFTVMVYLTPAKKVPAAGRMTMGPPVCGLDSLPPPPQLTRRRADAKATR
jgi:hypothetical protein